MWVTTTKTEADLGLLQHQDGALCDNSNGFR